MTVEWKISKEPVLYEDALSLMEERVRSIYEEGDSDLVWALEHPSLYTAGTSAKREDLLSANFPVYETGRGGQYTYHGPNQRVYYLISNLKKIFEAPDIKKYIWMLEECLIRSLGDCGVVGERRDGRVGIWVVCAGGAEKKIAAIGVRVRHWVAYHGVSVNLDPDLSHFSGIVPCGISEHGVTSLCDMGVHVSAKEFDSMFQKNYENVFNQQLFVA